MTAAPPGEFELIARLTARLSTTSDVVVGIGDDAAVTRWPAGWELVVTCDAQVEGRHFVLEAATPEELGTRALAVNLSDIAAMGAEPRYALVSLVISPTTPTNWLERYYAGLQSAASAYHVSIIGGNIAGTPGPFAADVTLIGQVEPGRAVRRSGARDGDAILVTGSVGAAAAGLLAFRNPAQVAQVSASALARVREAWVRPTAYVAAGRALAHSRAATAMIDISDGLAADLGHLLAASHAGAVVEAESLPIDEATNAVAHALGRDPVDMALYGGDDYVLLFTVSASAVESTHRLLANHGVSATRIGWIRPPGHRLQLQTSSGATSAIEPRGWDHLRQGSPSPHAAAPASHDVTPTAMRDVE